jgi:plastocyanin
MRKQITKWLTAPIVLLVMISIFNGCKKKDDQPEKREVEMQNLVFSPVSLTVPVGTTVTWINKESMLHTVTSSDNFLNSGDMALNATYSKTFTTAGTYSYYCIYHVGMTAEIIVQ